MILVDTSIWVDHLRHKDVALSALLNAGRVLTHPCVIGELMLGGLRKDGEVIAALRELPPAVTATDEECRSSSIGAHSPAPVSAMSMPTFLPP